MGSGLESLIPTGGVGLALVAVILYLLRANTVDRKDYRAAISSERGDAKTDVALLEQRIEAQIGSYRKLQELLDAERQARRHAEDEAARATRATERQALEIADLRARIDRQTTEIADLRDRIAELTRQ